MRHAAQMMLALAFLCCVCAGCARRSGGTRSDGLPQDTGLAGQSDVRMVVYQAAGFGHLPMPPQMSLRGRPRQTTAQKGVAAIFDAVNQPDGKAQTREARNNRLAFVARDGSVAVFGITVPTTVYGSDITAEHSSKTLGTALKAAMARASIVELAPVSPVQSVSYHDGSGSSPLATGVKNPAPLRELLACYSPLALKGNRPCKAVEVRKQAQRTPRFLTIKLAKPDALDAIVEAKDTDWPPKVCDTSARLEKLEFDTITVFHENDGLARFVSRRLWAQQGLNRHTAQPRSTWPAWQSTGCLSTWERAGNPGSPSTQPRRERAGS